MGLDWYRRKPSVAVGGVGPFSRRDDDSFLVWLKIKNTRAALA
jgi:hypothetical protein